MSLLFDESIIREKIRESLNRHIDDLQEIIYRITGDATKLFLADGLADIARKTIGYRSQWDDDAKKFSSDCGPACVAMLLAARSIQVRIDDLSLECGMGVDKKYTTALDLARGAAKHGIKLEPVSGWTIKTFAEHVPCIALVHYGSIPDRLDQKYTGGHWLVIVLVTSESVIVHDPDYWGSERDQGAGRIIPLSIFEQAMLDCRLDKNTVGYGLVMV
jgi:hypothetical protein